ncbi:Arf family GTPase ARL3 [Cyberlindnera jadinii NRRL Y-1542]
MYHLVKGIYSRYTMKEEYSVLILGLDNAGKTTFFEKVKSLYTDLKATPPERIHPTVGQNVVHINVDKIVIKFWDLGGQESLRSLWEEYYAHCHGIIFIVDSTDKGRLEECSDAFMRIATDDSIANVPILMLANKQDLEDSLEVEDVKEIFNKIAQHLSARDSRVLPISAITGEGVTDAIDWIKLRMIRNKEDRPPNYR